MKSFLSFLVIILFFISCDKNKDENPSGTYTNSVFIINEGPFQSGSGTISAYDRETGKVSQDIFEDANGRPLGNIVQSMTVYDSRGFIVVHKANKIEVVNHKDFKSLATIENIELPRYFIIFNEAKGYVSCWDSTVKVISLVDYSVIKSIKAGTGPDEMILSGDKLFVINSGGFSVDSTVSVINTITDTPYESIMVGHRPAGIQSDKNGNLWVLCAGKGWNGFPDPGDTPARLVCFNPSTLAILNEINFPDTENHPDNLIINRDGNMLYYNHPAGVFTIPISGSACCAQLLITRNPMPYGLGYDEKENMIYATDPLDYVQNGWVYRFNAADGSLVDSFMVGLIPNGFWFN